jgi:protein dithiol oxidoreductase (disulfide-forming)
MNSSFLLKYTLFGLTALGLLLPVGLYAQALPKDPYADQYELITPPHPPTTEGKVEVAEFFLYTCPHCYTFEDDLNLWVESKPSYVDFVKVPAVFNENQIVMAKVYYTAETLGGHTKLNTAIFKALHQDNRKLSNEIEMMQLFAENGVSNDDFRKIFHSFAVDMKVRQAAVMTSKHGISGVPAMTVQGKYRLSSGKAGGHTQLLKLIDYLAQESQLLAATPVQTPTTTPTPSETKESTDAKSTDAKDSPAVKPTSEAPPSTPAKETVQTPAPAEAKKETSESPTPTEAKESSETPKSSDTAPSSDTQTKTTSPP